MFEENEFWTSERTKFTELPPAYVRLKNYKRTQHPDLERCETEIKERDAKNKNKKFEHKLKMLKPGLYLANLGSVHDVPESTKS